VITIGLYGIRDTTHGRLPTYSHDHGLAVMRDGRVLTVVSLERWTGRKHDNRLEAFLPELLAELDLQDDVRFVSANGFVGDALVSTDGNFRLEPRGVVPIDATLVPARVSWYPDGLNRRAADGWAICHELAHVASLLPFVGRFEPNSLLVHIDGGASDSASSFWHWDGQAARLLSATWDQLKTPVNNFNVNPLVRAILGFRSEEHLAIPGKLMGYAGHGAPDTRILAWLEAHRFFLDGPEAPEALLASFNETFGTCWDRFDPREQTWRDVGATIQAHFEREVSRAILEWQRQTRARHLYYAGGAALNIPTNVLLERSGAFESVHIPPCTNDTGLALGAAAWLEYRERGEIESHGPFLGALGTSSRTPELADLDEVIHRLAAGQVIGVCNGAAEIGPRALGHRSILARADRLDVRRRVSEELKRREWYRPVAPVLLDHVAERVFGTDVAHSHLARFMLGAYRVRPEWCTRFAGVVHEDGTLRPQIVAAADLDQSWLVGLLDLAWREHGLPGLINTSFNGPGEPIVHRPDDALSVARRLGLDGVVIDGVFHAIEPGDGV
jgi:carbamoyltransferase